MFGAIFGDIVGSIYEFQNIKKKNFDLLDTKSFYTDDTVMTIAVAKSLVKCKGKYDNLSTITIKEMQKLFNNY